MDTLNSRLVEAMSVRLATSNISEHALYGVVKTLARTEQGGQPVEVSSGDVGICTGHLMHSHGDLIDFLKQLGAGPDISRIEITWKGVVAPSHFMVRVEHVPTR